MAWVRGKALAIAVSAPGSAPIGNSAPAENQGSTATAGVAAMYSSCLGTRLASVSATPYMNTANRSAAATNQATPEAVTWNAAPRSAATPTSAATWREARLSATNRLPATRSPRGIGAASSSRWAPLWRSTNTLSPAKTAVNGTSSPTVPTDTNAV